MYKLVCYLLPSSMQFFIIVWKVKMFVTRHGFKNILTLT